MSRDAQGNFNLPSPLNPVITGEIIESEWANQTMADLAAGLTDSLSRSGKGGMSAPLAMGGFRIVALGAAVQATDAPQATQVRDTTFNRLDNAVSDGNGNNYTASSLLTTPPVNGTLYLFIADKDNKGAMTMAVNNGAAVPMQINGAAIPPGIVLAGAVIGIMFINGTWRVTNTAGATGTINTVQSDNTDLISVTNNLATATATLTPHPNVPLGMAQLDSNGKVPPSQMPFNTLTFIGSWNASSGALPSGTPPNGSVYLITGAGTLLLFRPGAPPNENVYTQQSTPVVINDQILYKTPASTGQPIGWYYSPAPSGTATAANVSMVQTSATPPFGGITNVQSWLNAGDVAIRDKVSRTVDTTLAAQIFQPTDVPTTPKSLVNSQYVINSINGIPPGVDSFNGLTGDVVLTAAHVNAALTYVPLNPAVPTFPTTVTAPGFSTPGFYVGKGYSQNTPAAANLAGTVFDYVNGQSQIITLTAPVTITAVNNIPRGSVLRLTLFATNNAVTWPGTVNWPLGAAPDLSLGPLKKAIVVIENDGAVLLATSAAF